MDKMICFFKREAVLCAACFLAVISSFIIPPDTGYTEYIDYRTLGILFCLMAAMVGLRKTGIFTFFAEQLMSRVKSIRGLMFILVMLCFFFSMMITNDVSLITFVPFAMTVLRLTKNEKLMIPIVSLQTIAANLGSMLTPIGNPQNLYLYGRAGMDPAEFIALMFPYTLASFILLSVIIVLYRNSGRAVYAESKTKINKDKRIVIYTVVFLVSLLAVARIIDYRIIFVMTAAALLIFDRGIFKDIDYSLLITFAAFFIFIGNMGRIGIFKNMLESVINGRECITAVAVSQAVSNVPAALLLSGFTDKFNELIVGTNIGGLGTLIASMASLISFKYIAAVETKTKYLICFTLMNVLFLAVLMVMYFVLS